MSLRNASQLASLLHEFGNRLLGRRAPATHASNLDPDAAWKEALRQFKQVVTTASGANWFGDGQGDWKLLEPNGVELETAVRELLEHFGIPVRSAVGDAIEKGVDTARLATFYKMGLLLDVESLKKTCCPQYETRCPYCGRNIQEYLREAEGSHGGQDRQDPDLVQGTSQHVVNGPGKRVW